MKKSKRLLALLLTPCIFATMLSSVAMAASDNVITVDASLYPESEHDYTSNLDEIKTFTYPGAEKLIITFSEGTLVEQSYDFIYLYDGNGNQLAKYTGSQAAGLTLEITGDTFEIKLTSDGSGQKYGYSFSSIVAYMPVDADEISSVIIDRAGNELMCCTIAEALEVAEAGQTIALTSDAEVSKVMLSSGVVLDLNGNTLTANSVVTYSSNNIIDTSADVSGLLKINDFDGNMISPDNSSLPVYDKASCGLRFFEIDVESCAVTGKRTGNPKYWFKINPIRFERFNALIQTDANVQIKVKMSLDSQSTPVYASANLQFTKAWATSYSTDGDLYITVTVSETQSYPNINLTPCIVANGVEIFGNEM